MTEYDYSPEAYERYTRTQQRIAEWVDRTEEHRPHFGSAESPKSWGPAAPLLQSATKGIQSMFRRNRRPSSSDSSSDTYADTPQSPGRMQPLRPMNIQQRPAPQHQQHHSSHEHSSRRSSHSHKPHRPTYVVTTPPTTVPGYAYIYTNPQGTPGVMIVPPKGSVATSPPPSYYQPSAPASAYPIPQSAPAAASFTYTSPTQTQAQSRPQIPQIYSQTTVSKAQPQAQYAQPTYPPVIYPLTPYTMYPQQAQASVQAPPQIIYEMSSRKKHRRSESSRRSR